MHKIKLTQNGFTLFERSKASYKSIGPSGELLVYWPGSKEYTLTKMNCKAGECGMQRIYKGKNRALVNKFLSQIKYNFDLSKKPWE